jgi:signal transduction histidine kinase
MLLEGACGPQTPESIQVLERMQQSAGALLGVVNDCLDMSRLEAGEIGVRRERVSLGSLREDLEREVTGLIQERPVAVRWQVDSVPPVVAERTKLRVVLFNLLVNAIKASQGEIAVLAEECQGRVQIAVHDHGAAGGTRAEDLVFEPFVDEPTAGSGGAGLGLTIARQLTVLMGGSLEVASAPGAGRVFTLSLQRAVPGDAPADPGAAPRAA